MVIKPKVRGFVCTTAHPHGCVAHVNEQIEYVKNNMPADAEAGPKNVLVIGSSTGYGLASRIVSAFGYGAKTLGLFFEKEPTESKPGTAGWYNNRGFEMAADKAGLWHKSINGDAFSNQAKEDAIKIIKEEMGKIDTVIYSLASPRRQDPETGEVYKSVLKPIGEAVTEKTLNTDKGVVHDVSIEPATEDDIQNTIKVMGGEDWELWMKALDEAGVLADGVKTVAYTYIGKKLTWPIYGHATIGKAKEDLDRASHAIHDMLQNKYNGTANVAVLKAVVTQASSAIPVMPLYISLLYKVMKENGVHEDPIHQIKGLIMDQMYGDDAIYDDTRRYRLDLKELDDSIQNKVEDLWQIATTENINDISDYKGYQHEFFKLFGFEVDGVDYDADVDPRI
ncbi:enoyl-[acyl-carrier-protein] reductase FabV [Kangiella profundi]|uniref:Enoyl-[acyl-carrier-protein] reductase [NADH] n=1 Tax=Kangiella profundi TaxID=1561924 RepID=A0A2K9AGY0_9GAMM|nr:enoyl-ACP reductase FabV [Kangiella profundi]AUD78214.1 enoyl-[acyl-carrier-protein] reductase FabV [Kangiella profundi]GGF06132.1 enoyl-[acyl-carrier-protein] reductase [NADH] [Kangiella profundi]